MKIKFSVDNGANIHSCKTWTFTPEQLGYTEEEWRALSENDKFKEAEEWANQHIEIWYEEIED